MWFHGFTQAGRRAAMAAAAAAIAALTAAACGVAPSAPSTPPGPRGPAVVVILSGADGTTVPVAVGDRVEVILSSRYWDLAGSSSPRVLRQDGPATPMPRPSSCPVNIRGDGCIPIQMKFTALADGKAVITANRISCGEAMLCGPDQPRFTVTVMVGNRA